MTLSASGCPVCRAVVSCPEVDVWNEYVLHLCPACDVVFAQPMRGQTPEQAGAESLELDVPEGIHWRHRRFLEDLPNPGGRLLEVGCGSGEFLAAARRRGYQVTGIDFSARSIAAARRRHGLQDVHAMSLEQFLATRPPPFDVAVGFEVLEHVADPEGLLDGLRSCLKPDGMLALSTPFRDRWPRWWVVTREIDSPPHHLTRWSRKALEGLLSRRGFEVRRLVTGWIGMDHLLYDRLRTGWVRALLRGKGPGVESGSDAVRKKAAHWMHAVKFRACQALGAPANAALWLAGSRGTSFYVLAHKREPSKEATP